MKRMIGTCRVSQGHSCLRVSMSFATCTFAHPTMIIHGHLDHLSISKLQDSHIVFTLLSFKCKSCQLEKYTCIPFPNRPNKWIKLFKLVYGILAILNLHLVFIMLSHLLIIVLCALGNFL